MNPETSTSLASVLPQLSTAVVAILVLAAILYFVIKYLQKRDEQLIAQHNLHMKQIEDLGRQHGKQLDEREQYARARETEFRSIITDQLTKNTGAMAQSSATILSASKTMERLLAHLDGYEMRKRRTVK
jgi:hypothetical protein